MYGVSGGLLASIKVSTQRHEWYPFLGIEDRGGGGFFGAADVRLESHSDSPVPSRISSGEHEWCSRSLPHVDRRSTIVDQTYASYVRGCMVLWWWAIRYHTFNPFIFWSRQVFLHDYDPSSYSHSPLGRGAQFSNRIDFDELDCWMIWPGSLATCFINQPIFDTLHNPSKDLLLVVLFFLGTS